MQGMLKNYRNNLILIIIVLLIMNTVAADRVLIKAKDMQHLRVSELRQRTARYIAADIPPERLERLKELIDIYPEFTDQSTLDVSVPLINAPEFWSLGFNGSGVKIAVLDTGIDASHPMFAGKVVAAEDFSESGQVDDVYGHGTHVAGIAAGLPVDGYAGVAPGALLMNGKVLNDFAYGTTSTVIEGIEWAVANGADIISLSLGAPTPEIDIPLKEAIEYSVDADVPVVIAAGNCGPGCPNSDCGFFRGVTLPGNIEAAITVGATDDSLNVACFSGGHDFGSYIKPDVSAPGVVIKSAKTGGGFTTKSGTSMSTPHVSGAIALMLQKDDSLNAIEIKNILEDNALDLGVPGKDISYGSGFMDLSEILDYMDANLKQGWNLISYPEEITADALAGLIGESLISIFAYIHNDSFEGWEYYIEGFPDAFNSLKNINPQQGIWIELDDDVNLELEPTEVDVEYDFQEGWNLIGYPHEEVVVEDFLGEFIVNVTGVYGYSEGWNTWFSFRPPELNDLEILRPGFGYWVEATSDFTIEKYI